MQETTSGFILIDKESGPSSHDVVNALRKITGIKKIGHAGTLDPLASGLMILAIGRAATKNISQFVKMDKQYIAEIKLGQESDSYDRKGKILKKSPDALPEEKEIKKVLQNFIGEQEQIPPMYSAKKVGGKKLYDLARKGIEIERKPSQVHISNIDFISYKKPLLKIKIDCSSGTYIRSLARDIGEKLGSGALLEELRRTKIGAFDIKNSHKTKKITPEDWRKKIFNPRF